MNINKINEKKGCKNLCYRSDSSCLLADPSGRCLRDIAIFPGNTRPTRAQHTFNIQYLHHRDPRFRAGDIHSAVCARAKDRYLRIRPITYVCRRSIVKSRPSRRRDLLFIRLSRSLFEYSASTSYVACRQALRNRSRARYNREGKIGKPYKAANCPLRGIL